MEIISVKFIGAFRRSRQQLRLIERYLEALKSIEPKMKELQMLFNPKYYDIAIQAVNIVAKYNEDTELYEIPHYATALGTCLKTIQPVAASDILNMRKILEKTQNISAHDTTNTDTTNTNTTPNSIISNSTMDTSTSENSIEDIQNTDESDILLLIKKKF